MAKARDDWESRIGRRLKLRDLHILSVVVRWGSMAKAAAHLDTSQSVVSEAIANLESALGVHLLDRSPRGIEPTVYATALLKRGHVVFDELREGIKDIESLAGQATGEVRIACPEFLAAGLVTDAIDGFSRRHPQIVCQVVEADVSTLDFRQLQERSVDLMVTRVPNAFSDDELNVEILFDDPHLVVAGVKSPWASRRTVTLAELAGEPWIIPPSLLVNAILKEAFEAQDLQVPAEKVVTSFILMRNHLLATGRFLTVLPESVLRYNAKQWALRALPIKLRATPQPIAIVNLKNRTVSPAVALFIAHLRTVAKAYLRRRGQG
ncbi:MAG: LysR family transcriptional regulator [Pseudolabrys sp.]|nr:LysR family transcriptional regulator [Pseudolabrys sp.]MDP2297760.1 LysR family transcriptional regulator [Pseudolabrys sp.]